MRFFLAVLFTLIAVPVHAQAFDPPPLTVTDFPSGFTEGASRLTDATAEGGGILIGNTFGGTATIPVIYSYIVASLPHAGAASGTAVDMVKYADPGGREAPRLIPGPAIADEVLWYRASSTSLGRPQDQFTVVLRSGSCAAYLFISSRTSNGLSPNILIPTAELLALRLSTAPECNRDE